jgi:DNA-binding GntR family transcriptional regulator
MILRMIIGLTNERGVETDESYNQLYQAILSGEFQPHERLIELDLAQRYGVGRTAIRTALARLEQDRLVEREVNRGARVGAILVPTISGALPGAIGASGCDNHR